VDRLSVLVRQLQGMLGGKAIRVGADTMHWSASTDSDAPKVITHGFDHAPTIVAVFNADTAGSYAGIAAFTTDLPDATTFRAYGRTPSAITGTKAIYWLAIG
jgi:hypothetical protein